MRAGSGIKYRIVFQNYNRSFHGVRRRSTALQYPPTFFQRAAASGLARIHGFRRNGPCAAMHNKRWFHFARGFPESKVVAEFKMSPLPELNRMQDYTSS